MSHQLKSSMSDLQRYHKTFLSDLVFIKLEKGLILTISSVSLYRETNVGFLVNWIFLWVLWRIEHGERDWLRELLPGSKYQQDYE